MKPDQLLAQIWDYLNLDDDEILIVPVFNQDTNRDIYYVTRKEGEGLITQLLFSFPDVSSSPFRMIQRRNSEGKLVLPTIKNMKNDSEMDY